ncbi:carboxypeptidase-like regulatory domain-containing protein [Puia sp. P3]|uniref:carboxypeptidase-like regulatory domain-containing protein n=1 Tax=Puia sp. P3 TaxID=3423952 RepID=UPI003D668171
MVFLFSLICISLFASAQAQKVTGVVSDSTGAPFQGVTVMVEHGKSGTTTDANGRFTIAAPKGAVLVFTYANKEGARMTVGDELEYRVRMAHVATALNDVIVVGYGRQKKVNLVGAVGTVNVDEKLNGRAIPNISEGLTGLVPGLQATQSSGMAGRNGAALLIRGTGNTQ